MDAEERTRCPVCGYDFGEVHEVNHCPAHKPLEYFMPDKLIGPDDDCAYDI